MLRGVRTIKFLTVARSIRGIRPLRSGSPKNATAEDGEWSDKTLCRVRVFRKVNGKVLWAIWQESDGADYVQIEAWRDVGLSEIPVVPIHINARVKLRS